MGSCTIIFPFRSANADLDTQLETEDGTVLLQYCYYYSCYVNWCVTCADAQRISHNGMTIRACVDRCVEDTTMGPYYDGSTYALQVRSSHGITETGKPGAPL